MGVTVVTTCDGTGTLHGVTANSFSSVSLDPPLVLWSQSLASRSHAAHNGSDTFAVNILADTLSYGEQRRLEIARAPGADPKLLPLDEPRNPFHLSSDTNHSSENPHSHTNKPDLLECRIDR